MNICNVKTVNMIEIIIFDLCIFLVNQDLFQKIRACVRYSQKRTRKSSKGAQLWIFSPHFYKFRAFTTLHLPKQHVFLEVLVENKAFYFSERALHAGSPCNKWLK